MKAAVKNTLTVKDTDTFVKENNLSSCERITVFTQVSCNPANPMPLPEFVVKGNRGRGKLHPPPAGVHAQWSDSYR